MKLPMIHHPGYTIDLPASHPFPMRKFQVLREQLAAPPFDQTADWWQPAPADRKMLLHAHTAEYVDAFLNGTTDPRAQKRTGFQWSEALVERVRLETGGTVLALQAALETGLALNTAGGTHHAHADAGSGYCLVNDIAIAARHAVASGWARRVLIVDLDVHQGDGTAAICKDDTTVFTFSMHAGSNFPARKHPGDLDIALDRLGHLELTDDGVLQRDRTVLETCRNNGTPVAAVIGGGYDRDIEALARRHGLLFQAAVGLQGGRE